MVAGINTLCRDAVYYAEERGLYTVFVVDDEPWVLKSIETLISWNCIGFHIVGLFSNAKLALEEILAFHPHVVITDISMPILDGLSMMEFARTGKYKGEFIILTGYDEFSFAQKALDHRAYSYLLKPIDRTDVSQTMERLSEDLDQVMVKELLFEADGVVSTIIQSRMQSDTKGYRVVSVEGSFTPRDLDGCKWSSLRNKSSHSVWLLATDFLDEHLLSLFTNKHDNRQYHIGISEVFTDLRLFSQMLRHSEIARLNSFMNKECRVHVYTRTNYALIRSVENMLSSRERLSSWSLLRKELQSSATISDLTLVLNMLSRPIMHSSSQIVSDSTFDEEDPNAVH